MIKQYLFALTFLISSIGLFAQCPISVALTSFPDVSVSAVCESVSVQILANPSPGAIGNVTQYVWVIENDTILNNSATINVFANSQNVVVYMETTAGCSPDTVSTSIQIQTVTLEPIVNPVTTECNQRVTDLQITTSGNGSPLYTYELSGFGTNSDGFFNAVSQGVYTLFTTNSQGCKDTALVEIVFDLCDPVPTEAISPNGDGFHDTWVISNIQFYPENEVYIFDRWGQRVYHKKGYDNADGWGAEYLGLDLPVSTYYYLLEIKSENSEDDIIMRGPISVFR